MTTHSTFQDVRQLPIAKRARGIHVWNVRQGIYWTVTMCANSVSIVILVNTTRASAHPSTYIHAYISSMMDKINNNLWLTGNSDNTSKICYSNTPLYTFMVYVKWFMLLGMELHVFFVINSALILSHVMVWSSQDNGRYFAPMLV